MFGMFRLFGKFGQRAVIRGPPNKSWRMANVNHRCRVNNRWKKVSFDLTVPQYTGLVTDYGTYSIFKIINCTKIMNA
jgi:hypothetical protein